MTEVNRLQVKQETKEQVCTRCWWRPAVPGSLTRTCEPCLAEMVQIGRECFEALRQVTA